MITYANIAYANNDSIKITWQEYIDCVSSRLTLYKERSEDYPEELPMIKSFLLSQASMDSRKPVLKLLREIPMPRPDLNLMRSYVMKHEINTQIKKRRLLQLLAYFQQYDNPGQQNSILPLEHFISRPIFQKYIPGKLLPRPLPSRHLPSGSLPNRKLIPAKPRPTRKLVPAKLVPAEPQLSRPEKSKKFLKAGNNYIWE